MVSAGCVIFPVDILGRAGVRTFSTEHASTALPAPGQRDGRSGYVVGYWNLAAKR